MIIENQPTDITVIGDIQEFKTSIDPRNLEFITTLLSSNLYSNPEASFLREIISNAWDSHVEAGNTAEPIIVKMRYKNPDGLSITIRDYGTGLSPERFQNIFCNIGSSTKRDSNAFTGGFGIGRFSCLACSDTVKIVSYYCGTRYDYVMSKSGNTIVTHLLNTSATTEKNGLSVSIENMNYPLRYTGALRKLVFFPNVYVDFKTEGEYSGNWEMNANVNTFNKCEIRRYKTFAATSSGMGMIGSDYILLGNVLYPLDESNLDDEHHDRLDLLTSDSVFPMFSIGELEITPNRENLIYTQHNINTIQTRIDEMYEEVKDMIFSQEGLDCKDTFEAAHKGSTSYWHLDLIEGGKLYDSQANKSGCLEFHFTDFGELTLEGKKLNEFNLREINNFWTGYGPNFISLFKDFKFFNAPVCNKDYRLYNIDIYMMEGGEKFTASIKMFMLDKYLTSTQPAVILDYCDDYTLQSCAREAMSCYDPDLEKRIAEDFKKRVVVISKDSAEYKEYLEARKAGKVKEKPKKTKKFYLTKFANFVTKKPFDSEEELIEELKTTRKCCILYPASSVHQLVSYTAGLLGYMVYGVTKDLHKKIMALNLSNIRTPEWFMQCRKVRKLKAVVDNLNEDLTGQYDRALSTIPSPLYEECKELYGMFRWSKSTPGWYFLKNDENVKADPYWDWVAEQLEAYRVKFQKGYEMSNRQDYTSTTGQSLIYATILKSKSYRINQECYNQYKNNYLTKLLCAK